MTYYRQVWIQTRETHGQIFLYAQRNIVNKIHFSALCVIIYDKVFGEN